MAPIYIWPYKHIIKFKVAVGSHTSHHRRHPANQLLFVSPAALDVLRARGLCFRGLCEYHGSTWILEQKIRPRCSHDTPITHEKGHKAYVNRSYWALIIVWIVI